MQSKRSFSISSRAPIIDPLSFFSFFNISKTRADNVQSENRPYFDEPGQIESSKEYARAESATDREFSKDVA